MVFDRNISPQVLGTGKTLSPKLLVGGTKFHFLSDFVLYHSSQHRITCAKAPKRRRDQWQAYRGFYEVIHQALAPLYTLAPQQPALVTCTYYSLVPLGSSLSLLPLGPNLLCWSPAPQSKGSKQEGLWEHAGARVGLEASFCTPGGY